jgi:hypothetical protein
VVEVVVSGDPRTTVAVEAVVRELLARLPVILEWSQASGIDPGQVLARHAPDARVVARAWMDLRDVKQARIYVGNTFSERFIVRVVPLRNGYDEIAHEVLGHIIESAVDAFLAGGDVGVTREIAEREVVGVSASPPRPPVPSPAPKADGAEAARIGVALSYRVTELAGSKVLMHGPAIGVGLAFPNGNAVRFSSSAALHYRLPLHWDSPSVGARFDGGTANLAAGIDGDVARRVVLRGQAGLGVDLMRLGPYVQPGSTAMADAPFWVTSLMATAFLSLEAAFSNRVALLIGAGCEVDMSGRSYFVANVTGRTTALSPWIVRPTAMLGLVFSTGNAGIDRSR